MAEHNTSPLINVRNFNIHKLTEDTREATTYEAGKHLAEVITLNMTPQLAEGELFADGYQTDSTSAVTAIDISLNVRGLDPAQQAELLGYESNEDGLVTVTGGPRPTYFGATFEAERSDGSWEYFVIYKLKFSPITKEFGTKGSSIDFKTPNVAGKSLALRKLTPENDTQFYSHILGSEENEAITSAWHDAPTFLTTTTP